MELGLEGRVALVVGGTAGLGLAIGRTLAAEGVAVALAGRRAELAMSEAATFARGVGVAMDMFDVASIRQGVEKVEAELGEIGILILNSGGPPPSNVLTLDDDDLRKAGELLLYGPLELVKATLPQMQTRKWGRIVSIGSSGVQQPISALASSSMFRAAVASYLKLLAEAVAIDGITVNMALPGRIATDRTIELDTTRAKNTGMSVDSVKESSEKMIPVGRYGTPEEFGALVAFLCSEGARYITGEQIRVDGGLIRSL